MLGGVTMTIIFVRLRRERARGERERVTHVIPMPDEGSIPNELVAYCGTIFAPGDAEAMPGVVGMPCTACLITAPVPEQREFAPRRTPLALPEVEHHIPVPCRRVSVPVTIEPGAPALGLRDERLVHRVPNRPISSTLDGRTVVVTVCGVLAWAAAGEPPFDWLRCRECTPMMFASPIDSSSTEEAGL